MTNATRSGSRRTLAIIIAALFACFSIKPAIFTARQPRAVRELAATLDVAPCSRSHHRGLGAWCPRFASVFRRSVAGYPFFGR